jgi:hypothetical protein
MLATSGGEPAPAPAYAGHVRACAMGQCRADRGAARRRRAGGRVAASGRPRAGVAWAGGGAGGRRSSGGLSAGSIAARACGARSDDAVGAAFACGFGASANGAGEGGGCAASGGPGTFRRASGGDAHAAARTASVRATRPGGARVRLRAVVAAGTSRVCVRRQATRVASEALDDLSSLCDAKSSRRSQSRLASGRPHQNRPPKCAVEVATQRAPRTPAALADLSSLCDAKSSRNTGRVRHSRPSRPPEPSAAAREPPPARHRHALTP